MNEPAPDDDLAPIFDLRDRTSQRREDEDLDTDRLLGRLGDALPSPPRILRVAIVALAVVQLALVLPWLVDTDPFGLLDSSSGSHLTRDGSLGLVVAVVSLLTAWRPRWALPCFIIGSLALIAQAVAGLFDDSIAGTGASEFVHLPSIVLTCLVGLAAVPLAALGPDRRRTRR